MFCSPISDDSLSISSICTDILYSHVPRLPQFRTLDFFGKLFFAVENPIGLRVLALVGCRPAFLRGTHSPQSDVDAMLHCPPGIPFSPFWNNHCPSLQWYESFFGYSPSWGWKNLKNIKSGTWMLGPPSVSHGFLWWWRWIIEKGTSAAF